MVFKTLMQDTQTNLLLNHFKKRNSISAMEAAGLFRIRSLSRRINDLEAQGHIFSRENAVDTTGQRYVRYHYIGQSFAPQTPPVGRLGLALAAR